MAIDHSFFPIDLGDIDEVIKDIDFLRSGAIVHFVVDPFEISNFCFPAQQARVQGWTWPYALRTVLALYEVFYGHSQRPILLDEYNYELLAMLRYFQKHARQGLDDLEYFEGFKGSEGGLLANCEGVRARVPSAVTAFSVAQGVFFEGFSKLGEILEERIAVQNRLDAEKDGAYLRQCFDEHLRAPDYAIDVAVDSFQKIFGSAPMTSRSRYRNSIIIDAQAICRLVEIQMMVSRDYEDGKLKQPHIFYYVSSANRTRLLVEVLEGRKKLPVIEGETFSFWRTPQQILIRLLCASEGWDEANRRLKRIRVVVEASKEEAAIAYKGQIFRKQLEAYRKDLILYCEKVKGRSLAPLLSAGERVHRFLETNSGPEREKSLLKEIEALMDKKDWKESIAKLAKHKWLNKGDTAGHDRSTGDEEQLLPS